MKSAKADVTLRPMADGVDLTIKLPDKTCKYSFADGLLILHDPLSKEMQIRSYFSTKDNILSVKTLDYWSTYVIKMMIRCIDTPDIYIRQRIYTGFPSEYLHCSIIFFITSNHIKCVSVFM